MPLRISPSLRRRSLFQSVPSLGFEILPEVAPFMRLCPPRRDDAPFAIVFILVNHSDLQAVHKADRINSNFAIIETIIDPLDSQALENALSVSEGNSVPSNIAAVFPFIPSVAHKTYSQNVNIQGGAARFTARTASSRQTRASTHNPSLSHIDCAGTRD